MARLESLALPVAKITLIVKRVRGANRTRAFHPAHDEALLVNIVALQPRCLTSPWFFRAVNIQKDTPPFGISPRVASTNAPFLRRGLLETPKGVSQKRFPIHMIRRASGFHRLKGALDSPVQDLFSICVRVCA